MKNSVKWTLMISLVLNVLLVGILIGRNGPEFRHAPGFKRIANMKLEGISEDKQKLFEQKMQAINEDNIERFRKIDSLRDEVTEILKAPEFDRQAFLDKSKQLDDLFSQGKKQMISTMADIADEFTPEERAILAEQLRRPPMPPKPADENTQKPQAQN